MIFSSSAFLLAFMPLALAAYYLMPGRVAKNLMLLAVSLAFYAWGDPTNLGLLLVSIVVSWLAGLALGRAESGRTAAHKAILALAIVFDLALLCFFKYENFFAQNVNALTGASIPLVDLALPLGISYFTLKNITYVVDVFRGDAQPQKNPFDYALFVSFFPAMTAGPTIRYRTIEGQLRGRKESLPLFTSGARLFCIGLAKKVILSNTVAILATDMLAAGGAKIGLVGAWAGLIAYSFQLYFDFSGYSDMAIGLAKMFGFRLEKNFNYPYISKSGAEFWRRWHISLSSFFRDYIYIPLGGSRVGSARLVLNTAVVWVVTGIWHGAAWNFIYWGLFYLVVILLEKFVYGQVLRKLPSAVQHLYAIFIFMMGWALFWIADVDALVTYLAALFGAYGLTGTMTMWELQAWSYVPVFAICIVASTPIALSCKNALVTWARGEKVSFAAPGAAPKAISTDDLCCYEEIDVPQGTARGRVVSLVLALVDVALLALAALSILSIVAGSFSPLIYFNF